MPFTSISSSLITSSTIVFCMSDFNPTSGLDDSTRVGGGSCFACSTSNAVVRLKPLTRSSKALAWPDQNVIHYV